MIGPKTLNAARPARGKTSNAVLHLLDYFNAQCFQTLF